MITKEPPSRRPTILTKPRSAATAALFERIRSGTSPVLMCPPTKFGIEYEINPWMDRTQGVDRPRAQRQWNHLYQSLKAAGASIHLAPPPDALPDFVFSANAGIFDRGLFTPAQFTHPERQGEERLWRAWFERRGQRIATLTPGLRWEGEGDALISDELLIGGYGFRSELTAQREVARLLERPLLALQLCSPWFYHLDPCLFPLSREVAFYSAEAFTPESLALIKSTFRQAIAVPQEEARRFACNAIALGQHVIMAANCPTMRSAIEARGYAVHEVDLSEFLKSGGGAKCLTLHLDHPAAVPSGAPKRRMPVAA